MATKLARYTLQQFGSTVNGAAEVGIFGSGVSAPVYTGSITLMQSYAAWNRGWAAETIANNRPFLEDMNAVHCVFGYNLCYLMQEGIPEYDAGTTYFLNSICQYSGTVYQVINDNAGAGISATLPTNATYWKILIAPLSSQNVVTGSRALGSVYHNTTGKVMFVSAIINIGMSQNATAVSDNSSSPSTEVAYIALSTVAGANTLNFMVLPGNYYEVSVSSGGSIITWTEWY